MELFFRDAAPEGVASPPLTVIAIHGFGSNEEDLLGLGQHLDLPLRFVAPRGPIELRHAFGAGYAWFEFASLGQPEPDSFHRSVELLVDFVNDVRTRHHIPAERLILMGFSQGAVMSIATALSVPDQIGGVVALSGYFPRPAQWTPPHDGLAGLPVLVTHGTADDVLPVEWGREAAEALQGLGADVRYEEFAMAHQVSPACIDVVRAWLQARIDVQP